MLLSVILYSIQIILPFMGALITYYCLRSLFENISPEYPLVAFYNQTNKKKIPILYWENSIGRDKHSDIVVDSPMASRNHAVFCRRNEGWIISDTNSKCGVLLNGEKISKSETVYIDDVVEIGGEEYKLSKSEILGKNNVRPLKAHAYSNSSILVLISIFGFLAALVLCFSSGSFNYNPMIIFGLLFSVSWISYFVTAFIFKRVNFEIELLGIFLSSIGILTLGGVDMGEAYTQIAALGIGIIFFNLILFMIREPDLAMRLRPYIAIMAVILLIINLVFGKVKNGSQNWIMIGHFSFQPSELVKVAFIFFGTSTLQGIQTTKNLTGFIIFSGICMGALILMGDFGTASVFFITFILISFMRSGNIRTVFLICAAAAIGFLFIMKFKPYIITRFSAWRHVWEHINDTGYQQTRVLTYAASGGLLGLGLGKGCLKYIFAAPSDLVFGMLCEEWGLILAVIILFSIAFLGIYSRKASVKSRSAFYSIAACCASGMIVFQMIMNVFGVVDILPLTGVTLPFVSQGGSSLISVWGLLAFIKASDERTYALRR